MERKTVHALLLSLAVVAGGVMMTTDAHAQTNTERLITTVDNTNSIMAALNALADAVADGFASVLAAIGAVQADTSSIMTEIGHVESELATVHGEVDGISSELATVHSEVEDIGSNVASLDSSLQSISNDIAGLSSSVAGSGAAFTNVNDAIARNSAAINDLSAKLDMIGQTLGVVQTTVETQEDVDPAVTNTLHTAETEQTVAVADFAGTVTKHPTDGVYEASNTFSCTGDVFLDSMTITDVDAALFTVTVLDTTADMVAPKTTVSLNGVNLYETYDNSGDAAATDANVLEITKDRDFDNQFLSAGSTLVVKGSTDQSVDADTAFAFADIATRGGHNVLEYEFNATATGAEGANVYFTLQDYVNLKSNKATINATNTDTSTLGGGTNQATKVQLGTTELYTITVNWFAASSDTTCSITSAVETVSGLPNADNTVLVALNLDSDSDVGPPTPFLDAKLDCNGEDTEITNVSIQAGAIAGLNQFIEVELSAGGESADVSFDNNDVADTDASDLPFRFSGSDLTISGAGIGTLLLQVSYDTTQGNTCRAS